MSSRRPLAAVLAAGLLASAAACGDPSSRSLLVLVASSAHDAVREAAGGFTASTGHRVRVAPGPSNALAAQVLAGAPADLLLVADGRWARAVEEADRAARTAPLLRNRMVLVVPRGNPASVARPADLLAPGVRHVALAGPEVPAGRYAEQALGALGILDPLLSRERVVRGHDVRGTLAWVERGEAEAAVVYATDARITPQVEVVHTFPEKLHDEVVYPLVLLVGAPAGGAARLLFEHLRSGEAARVLRRHGFLVP